MDRHPHSGDYYAAVDEITAARPEAHRIATVLGLPRPERYATPDLLAAQIRYEAACSTVGGGSDGPGLGLIHRLGSCRKGLKLAGETNVQNVSVTG